MTVSAEDLADYSPFSVSDDEEAGPLSISTATFQKFATLTKNKLDRENPGLSTEEYDQAHALLIAHTIVAKSGSLDKSVEWLDSYKYEKQPGVTSFLLQYNAILEDFNNPAGGKQPTGLILHADRTLGEKLKLDQARIPDLFDIGDVEEDLEP